MLTAIAAGFMEIIFMLNLFTPRQVQTVGQLLGQIKKLNEQQFKLVWVEGEIRNFTRAGSGHLYFSLSDGQAALRVVMFRNQAAYLRFTPQDGQKILCRGQVSVYSPRGELQFVADNLEPLGAGAAAYALEQLKQRLAAQGLFEQQRKRALPMPVRRVLLLTSLQGAAVHDFLKVIRRSPSGLTIRLWPIQVQGAGALPSILPAFQYLQNWDWPQVVVITRGGGSSQDLAVFNEEALVRAVASSPVPVLSAVGHEVDISLCDLAADARAATPTAAAEMLLQPWEEAQRQIELQRGRLARVAVAIINLRHMRLDNLKSRLRQPGLKWQQARLNDLNNRMQSAWRHKSGQQKARLKYLQLIAGKHSPLNRLKLRQDKLARLRQKCLALMQGKLAQQAGWWQSRYEKLNALNPLAVLTRGYALAQTQDGRIIRNSGQVAPGDDISLRLAQGGLLASVKAIIE